MKKIFRLTLALSVGFILAGCSSSTEKLYIINWGEYIDPELIDAFEEEFDVKVVYEEVDSNEAMEAKIKAGGTAYDIAVPSDYMIEKLISEDYLLEINKENVPNMSHIDSRFLNRSYDPSISYSVPYFWGTVGIIYNMDLVDDADLTGWEILWNEKYENNIYMYDSVRDTFAVALLNLGYSINTKNDSELEEAKELLIEQLPLVRGFGTDDIKFLVQDGDAALGVVYNGDYLDLVYELEENEDEINIGYFVPDNGTNLWFDALVIPKTSENKELAEAFINFMTSPENAQQNTEWVGYSTVNKTAYDTMYADEEYVDWVTDPSYYPSDAVIDASEVYEDLSDYNDVYDRLYSEVKSGE